MKKYYLITISLDIPHKFMNYINKLISDSGSVESAKEISPPGDDYLWVHRTYYDGDCAKCVELEMQFYETRAKIIEEYMLSFFKLKVADYRSDEGKALFNLISRKFFNIEDMYKELNCDKSLLAYSFVRNTLMLMFGRDYHHACLYQPSRRFSSEKGYKYCSRHIEWAVQKLCELNDIPNPINSGGDRFCAQFNPPAVATSHNSPTKRAAMLDESESEGDCSDCESVTEYGASDISSNGESDSD